jgi:hypothetical protein
MPNETPIKRDVPPEYKARFREWGRQGGLKGNREKKAIAGLRGSAMRWKDVPRCAVCHRPLPKNYRFKGKTVLQTREIMARELDYLKKHFPEDYEITYLQIKKGEKNQA